MPALRILHDNAADRSTVTASGTAGNLTAALMLNDRRSQAHRSTGTSVSYTLTWSAPQSIGAVVLPAVNLTAGATIRVRLYSDDAGATLLHDTGAVPACPGLDLSWWSGTVNVNAFAFGALAKVARWLPQHYAARRVVIDLADPGNPAGYIDCARLLVGAWWSPEWGATGGADANVVDTSTATRNAAGELVSDLGTRHDTLSVELGALAEADRAKAVDIVRRFGTGRPFLVSAMPRAASPAAERDHMVYGCRSNAPMARAAWQTYATKLEMEGW